MQAEKQKVNTFRFSSVKASGTSMHSHHYHDLCEIYYMVSGECTYFINDDSYKISKGDVIFIPEGVVHKTYYDNKEHKRLLIECSTDYIPEVARAALSAAIHIKNDSEITSSVYNVLLHLEGEYKNRDGYSADAISSLLKFLFYTLARAKNSIDHEAKKTSMQKVAAYINQNYNTPISLSDIAAQSFVSPEHLSRSFKAEIGQGFCEYLSEVRLNEAQKLLEGEQKLSVSEIAYKCGFNDSNYFSDKFKKRYGISPVQYRKAAKSK